MIPPEWRTELLAVREIPGRGVCAIQRFIYTTGLLTNLSFNNLSYDYTARYCYPIATDALRALLEWDGQHDPPGDWIKEKVSGRTQCSLIDPPRRPGSQEQHAPLQRPAPIATLR
jgi:hypothetical protein